MSNMLRIREIERQLENNELTEVQRTRLMAQLIKHTAPKSNSSLIIMLLGIVVVAMIIGIAALK